MTKHLLITSDTLGGGDEELGSLLMKNFIYSIARHDDKPARISFMNEGVRLCCQGSGSLTDLELLMDAGVQIRACGTCLDYLELSEQLAVGERGTMPDTVDACLSDTETIVIS